jgi:hypothetical protein
MSITEAAGGRRTAKADAMEFLQAALTGDPVPATEVNRMAYEHEALIERNGFSGFQGRILLRARDRGRNARSRARRLAHHECAPAGETGVAICGPTCFSLADGVVRITMGVTSWW